MSLRAKGCVDCLKTTAGDCGQHGPLQNVEQPVGNPEDIAQDWCEKFHELQFKHILLQERLIQMLLAREDLAQGCPCLHTEPCSPACSCASPTMSGGCRRCCSYGDDERKGRRAERLAKLIDEIPP